MDQKEENLKKGLLPIVLLLIFSLLVSVWVLKNEPVASSADVSGMKLEALDLNSLLAEGKPVLLNVSSDNCPYCVIMEPELEKIYAEYRDVAVIRDINVSEYPEAYMMLPVRGTPMQVFFDGEGAPYEPSEEVLQQMNFLYYISEEDESHIMTVHEGMMGAEQMKLVLQDLGADV